MSAPKSKLDCVISMGIYRASSALRSAPRPGCQRWLIENTFDVLKFEGERRHFGQNLLELESLQKLEIMSVIVNLWLGRLLAQVVLDTV